MKKLIGILVLCAPVMARTFTLHPEKAKEWDEQLYCAPSEEFRFNNGVRNGAGGVK